MPTCHGSTPVRSRLMHYDSVFRSPPAWQPEVVKEVRFSDREPAQAAVLIPLVMRGAGADSMAVLLTERTAHLSTHSGQIAFPGGRVDECDADVKAAALREAYEEVGLEYRYVDVLGTFAGLRHRYGIFRSHLWLPSCSRTSGCSRMLSRWRIPSRCRWHS
jgi:8-oxo-dGTP pyrophosphatase MutT (NUDIX family)